MTLQRIYLIGFMGSGKSFVGRRLSKALGVTFVDLDRLLEQTYHLSINDFFTRYGENAFRQAEKSVLHSSQYLSSGIISTGGGTPCYFDNISWMKENGYTVYLKMSAGALCHRLMESKKPRPLLRDVNGCDLLPFIEAKLKDREAYYSQADLIYPGENLSITEFSAKLKEVLNID